MPAFDHGGKGSRNIVPIEHPTLIEVEDVKFVPHKVSSYTRFG